MVAASPCDGPDRGHHDLLLAFLSLARTRPRLKLLIAGEGPEAARLRAQAEAAGMLHRVVVHCVSLEQLPSIFSRAAAVVAPSRSGNSPDPVPEALAVGAPVVATAVGSHPSWIREGRTGWLVPPRAPVALAARLAPVVDDPVAAKKVGENARLAALELAAPRSVAQELARCYAAISRVPAQPYAGIYIPAPRRLQRA
jgi:glycosyltransferase involved in cell wall biosynthesis